MAQHPLKDGLSPLMVTNPPGQAQVPPEHSDHGSTIHYNSGSNMRPHPPGVGRQDGQDGIHEIFYNLQTTETSLQKIPENFLNPLIEFYSTLNKTSPVDLELGHLRPVFSSNLLVPILLFYLLLIIFGCLSNIFLFLVILKKKLYKEAINGCLLNMVVTAIFQLLVVVPLSLYVRLVQNWMLGELGCYLLPVIQDLPSHISMLSMFVANLIRYGKLLFPASSRPTPSLLLPLSWMVGLLLVLPYLPNIRHYHMHGNGPMFLGGQLCVMEEEEQRGRMVRGTFILLVSVPVVTSFYLLIRVWWVLCGMERDGTVLSRTESGDETEEDIEILAEDKNGNNNGNGKHLDRISSVGSVRITRNPSIKMMANEEEIFVTKEKETQMFLFLLLLVHVVFLLPLNIFKLVLPSLKQSSTPSSQLDIIYIILLWFSFIPPTTIPPLYAVWVTKRSGDQTLQDMFKIDDEKIIGQQEHERRMSNIKMEELNRRRASFNMVEDTVKSPQGSFQKSPQPSNKLNNSRQNSLRVAVQHRRASIISINPENLLEVAPGPSRTGSFRSSSNENLLLPTTTTVVVENGHTENGRRKSYAPSQYGRKGSFRNRYVLKL